jgi:hypothetical protein
VRACTPPTMPDRRPARQGTETMAEGVRAVPIGASLRCVDLLTPSRDGPRPRSASRPHSSSNRTPSLRWKPPPAIRPPSYSRRAAGYCGAAPAGCWELAGYDQPSDSCLSVVTQPLSPLPMASATGPRGSPVAHPLW